MKKFEVIQEGRIKGCQHKHQMESGHGTVCYFMECADCGAVLSYFTGEDHFLCALEASREP